MHSDERRALHASVTAIALAAVIGAGCSPRVPAPAVAAIGVARIWPSRDYEAGLLHGTVLAVERLNQLAAGRIRFEVRLTMGARNDMIGTVGQLRNDPSVIGIVGPIRSQQVLEAAPELSSSGRSRLGPVAALAPVATNPMLSGLSPWIFRVSPSDTGLAAAAARLAFDTLQARRALVLFANDAFGKDWARVFTAAFQAAGGRIIGSERVMFEDSTWWDTHIAWVRRMQPDLIVLPGSDNSDYYWVQRLRRQGINTPILFGDGGAELVDISDGIHGRSYIGFYQRRRPDPEAEWFEREYLRRHGEAPRHIAANAYDAALALGLAALAAGPDRQHVRDHLAGLSSSGAFAGATGSIAFDAHNDRVGTRLFLGRISP